MRASQGLRTAAEHIASRLRSYGLEDVEILQFPADGKTMFGTQKSRPSWDVRSAELWELEHGQKGWVRIARIADWEATPLSLAQDSDRADVSADLVDVGVGTTEADYRGKDVRGKLVLVSAQPEAVQALAVGRYGAAGIVSHAQNQRSAWWGADADLALGPSRQFRAGSGLRLHGAAEPGTRVAAASSGGRDCAPASQGGCRATRRSLRHRDRADPRQRSCVAGAGGRVHVPPRSSAPGCQ